MAKRKANKKNKKVSYYKQPERLGVREWQIALRKQFGEKQEFELKNEGDHPVWSDFSVRNPKNGNPIRWLLGA